MNTSKKLKIVLLSSAAVLVFSLGALTACGEGHMHNLQAHEAVAATCTEDGHTAYWSCTGCDELFADANGETVTTLEEVTLAALGHDTVAVAAKEATCTEDGCVAHYTCERCGMNFSDKAATQVMEDAIIRRYNHDQLTEVQAVEATPESAGNVYHWHCARCGKNFTSRNANQEIEDVSIPKLVKENVVINVTTHAADGSVTAAPTGNFTLTGTRYDYSNADDVTISDGKLSVSAIYADEYVLSIDGYYPVYFTVESGMEEYDIDLYQYFHGHTVVSGDADKVNYDYIDGDLKINFNQVPFYSSYPIVRLSDDSISGSNYMFEFVLQFKLPDFSGAWDKRAAIRLGTSEKDQTVGVSFLVTESVFKVSDSWTNIDNFGEGDKYNTQEPLNGAEIVLLSRDLLGEGARFRAGRNGDILTLRVYVNGVWYKVWEKSCPGLETGIEIAATAPGCTTTFSHLDYFEYVPATEEYNAHYESNGKYYTIDGEETTLEQLKVKVLKGITVEAIVYDGLRNEIMDTDGIVLCMEDAYGRVIEDVTIVDGMLSVSEFYAGRYTVTGDGIFETSIDIVDGTEEYFIKIYLIDDRFEVVNNDTRVVIEEVEGDLRFGFDHIDFQAYNPPVVTLKDDNISGSNYMVEFTVCFAFDDGASWSWMQRLGIRLGTSSVTDATFGISFFAASDSEFHVSLLAVGDPGFGEREMMQPFAKGSDEATAICSALKGDGVTFRAVRNGDKLYLSACLNGEWVVLYETDASGLGTGIEISASSNNSICYVSGISYADGYVEQTQDYRAHFMKGDQYITVDGVDTTREELAYSKAEIELTVSGYKDGKETLLSGTVTFFNDELDETTADLVDGQGTIALKVVNSSVTYEITCGEYYGIYVYDPEAGKSEAELILQYRYAVSTGTSTTGQSNVDLSHMNDEDHTINLSDAAVWNTKMSTGVDLNIPNEIKNSNYTAVSFTLKYNSDTFDANSRFGVLMADRCGIGVTVNSNTDIQVFSLWKKEDDIFDGWDNANNDHAAAVVDALRSGNGLNVVVIRADTYIRMFVELDGEWVELCNYEGVVTCGSDADTNISFVIMGYSWTFSDIEYGKLEIKADESTGEIESLVWGDMTFGKDGQMIS